MSVTQEFQDRVARIEGLVQKLEGSADPASRGSARELIQCLMELHGAGIERILEIVDSCGDAGGGLIASLGQDPLVSSLLVLYGLHPDNYETRVTRALDKVRPMLRERGAGLEALAVTESTVRVRITGAGSKELETAVREALFEAAPDAAEVVIEGAKGRAGGSNFVPLSSLVPVAS
ncbi:MAG: NifU family protein [Bryobacteraceae bacterium]|jgi:Fe-S cluster biogenesis protein NfuA